jgi:hypothetical protein
MNVEQKIEFLATTYGRDAYKAVNECPRNYIAWYECGGGGTVKEHIADDELDKQYFDDLVEHCEETSESDYEFWDNLSGLLSGFIIDGNPYKEDEDEEF